MKMKKSTWNFMIDTLVDEVDNHPHREEIISLMYEQLADDESSVTAATI